MTIGFTTPSTTAFSTGSLSVFHDCVVSVKGVAEFAVRFPFVISPLVSCAGIRMSCSPCLLPASLTCSAHSCRESISTCACAQVFPAERMAVFADAFLRILCGEADAAHLIFSSSDHFQVTGAYTEGKIRCAASASLHKMRRK